MADLKISQLNSGNPAQTNDEIPIARSGANFKITAGSISALPPTTAAATEVIYVNAAGTSLDGDSGMTYDATTGQLSLTGKTVTTNSPVLNLAQTWNNAGVNFTSARLNVTNTASGASSNLLDLQVAGSSVFSVTPSTTNPGLTVTNSSAATLFSVSNTTIVGTRTVQLTPSANTSALTVGSFSLSGSNAQSMLDLAGTWNTTGTPTALKLNVTDTASNAASNLLDLQVGGTSQFVVRKNGNTGIGTTSPGGKLDVAGTTSDVINTRYVNAAGGANLYLQHSRGATVGTNTILNAGDTIGTIVFAGANGTSFSDAAYISAQVDNTPGASNDMPGRLLFFTSADASASPTERMRLDSAGNLGLGVTPSAWNSGYKAIQIGTGGQDGSLASGNGITNLSTNSFRTTVPDNKYISNGFATEYQQLSGQHIWRTAPSGTAGNTISFTQAMTLFASGALWVGSSSELVSGQGVAGLNGASGTALGPVLGFAQNGTVIGGIGQYSRITGFGTSQDIFIQSQGSSNNVGINANPASAYIYFQTQGIERARITAAGDFGIGTNSPSGKLDVVGTGAVISRIGGNSTGTTSLYFGNTTGGVISVRSSAYLAFETNATERARIPAAGGMVVGTAALATTATDGFLYVPTCAGLPTGVPTTQTGTAPIVIDTTNNKLYFYSGGAWRDAGP